MADEKTIRAQITVTEGRIAAAEKAVAYKPDDLTAGEALRVAEADLKRLQDDLRDITHPVAINDKDLTDEDDV